MQAARLQLSWLIFKLEAGDDKEHAYEIDYWDYCSRPEGYQKAIETT